MAPGDAIVPHGQSRYRSLYAFSRTKLWRSLTHSERLEYLYEPEPNSGCWLWLGGKGREGYGKYGGRQASRVMYMLRVGVFPPELTIDHLCRNVACVNPDHLEPVTTQVNTLRGTAPAAVNARKVMCPSGHALGEPDAWGHRSCRICRLQYLKTYNATRRPNRREDSRLRMRRWRAKKKERVVTLEESDKLNAYMALADHFGHDDATGTEWWQREM